MNKNYILFGLILILSIGFVSAGTDRLIPLMTSPNTPVPFVVSASSDNGGNQQGWGAFINWFKGLFS